MWRSPARSWRGTVGSVARDARSPVSDVEVRRVALGLLKSAGADWGITSGELPYLIGKLPDTGSPLAYLGVSPDVAWRYVTTRRAQGLPELPSGARSTLTAIDKGYGKSGATAKQTLAVALAIEQLRTGSAVVDPGVKLDASGLGRKSSEGWERPARRKGSYVERIVRVTAVGRNVKHLHNSRCQACGETILTPEGPYAEAAHIRPLGTPHNGPDVEANVLCLCPNCHVRFDRGTIVIDARPTGLLVIDELAGKPIGPLRTSEGHDPGTEFLDYHRSYWRGRASVASRR